MMNIDEKKTGTGSDCATEAGIPGCGLQLRLQ